MTPKGPVEVWRGGVRAWECDDMGHMNVRFYVARAMQGLAGVAAALGMPDAFRAQAAASLVVRQHHIRFLNEARAGTPLHMTAGVLAMGEADATLVRAGNFTILIDAGSSASSGALISAPRSGCSVGSWPIALASAGAFEPSSQ